MVLCLLYYQVQEAISTQTILIFCCVHFIVRKENSYIYDSEENKSIFLMVVLWNQLRWNCIFFVTVMFGFFKTSVYDLQISSIGDIYSFPPTSCSMSDPGVQSYSFHVGSWVTQTQSSSFQKLKSIISNPGLHLFFPSSSTPVVLTPFHVNRHRGRIG